MTLKAKQITALCVHSVIVIMEVFAILYSGSYQGTRLFIFFTELSNILGGVVSLIYVCFLIANMKKGTELPEWLKVLRFVSASALALTFFTVICVLAPLASLEPGNTLHGSYIGYLTYKSCIITHTFGPITVMLSFLLLDDFNTEKFKKVWFGIIPTTLYVAVSITMNVLKKWYGPYPFLHVYEQPVWASVLWCFAMLAFSFVLCMGLWFAKKGMNKRRK